MQFLIGFVCRGEDKGWLANSAAEARKVIDALNGDISGAEFIEWIMANSPQWTEGATQMVNFCLLVA